METYSNVVAALQAFYKTIENSLNKSSRSNVVAGSTFLPTARTVHLSIWIIRHIRIFLQIIFIMQQINFGLSDFWNKGMIFLAINWFYFNFGFFLLSQSSLLKRFEGKFLVKTIMIIFLKTSSFWLLMLWDGSSLWFLNWLRFFDFLI